MWAISPRPTYVDFTRLRAALFDKFNRPGYWQLRVPAAEVKPAIYGHAEFTAYHESATKLFVKWKRASTPLLKDFDQDGHPKPLIETISEDLLATFKTAPLLDAYDVYQHLMDYWAKTMQDDCYLIADAGWKVGAQPREIIQVKNKENKLVWAEPHDYQKGKRRFRSDLIPAPILVGKYFTAEREALEFIEGELTVIEQQLEEMREEQTGEQADGQSGLLTEVNESKEGEKPKITTKGVKARLKVIGDDPDFADERKALKDYAALLEQQTKTKARLKAGQEDLDAKTDAKYSALTEDEIKTLVVDHKWLATIGGDVQGELDRVSHTLTRRIRQLAERYATPLPQLTDEVAVLAARVDEHLKRMGAVWK